MSWPIAKDARLLSAECLRLNLADTLVSYVVRGAHLPTKDSSFPRTLWDTPLLKPNCVKIMVDVSERLDVLLTQEECIYKTSDYLARLTRARETEELKEKDAKLFEEEAFSTPIPKKRKCLSGKVLDCSFDDDSSSSDQLSMLWREKICQWAYEGKWEHVNYLSLCNSCLY